MAALSTTAEMARKQAVSNEAKAFEARARLENKVLALEAAAAHAEPSISAATRLGDEADATANATVAARAELAAALHAANEARTAAAAKQELAKAAEKEYGLVALRAKRVREKAIKSLNQARKDEQEAPEVSADKSMAEAMMAEAYRLQTQVDAAEASKALENSGLRVTRAKERLEQARLFAAQQEAEASGQAQRAQQAFQAVRTPLTPTLTLLP